MYAGHAERLDAGEERLVAELYPSLRRFASVVRAPGEDGNDLVQEALLRTLRTKGSLTSLSSPGAYLRRVMLNLARDRERSEARRRRAWSKLAPPSVEVPCYSWELEELRLVSPKSRAVLYLRIIEGRPYSDISDLLGCSQVSARVAASRGKRQLTEILSREARGATA